MDSRVANTLTSMKSFLRPGLTEAERQRAVRAALEAERASAARHFADNPAAAACYGVQEGGPCSAMWDIVRYSLLPTLLTLEQGKPVLGIIQQTATSVRVKG